MNNSKIPLKQLYIQQIISNLLQERRHMVLLMKYEKLRKDLLTCTLSPYFHVFTTKTGNNYFIITLK